MVYFLENNYLIFHLKIELAKDNPSLQIDLLILILKILFVIGALVATYAVLRNLDIIKIILIYLERSNF